MLRAPTTLLVLTLACKGEPGTGPEPGVPGPGPAPEPEPRPGAECAPATVLCPGETLATEVNAAPEGTAFQLRAGVYRLQQVSPKAGQSFTGESGAVLAGAGLLTEWAREGAYWTHGGQVEQGEVRLPDACQETRPACALPEELFIDDQVLQRVTTLQAVSTGKWYFDYASYGVYVADDPTGKRVEISGLP